VTKNFAFQLPWTSTIYTQNIGSEQQLDLPIITWHICEFVFNYFYFQERGWWHGNML